MKAVIGSVARDGNSGRAQLRFELELAKHETWATIDDFDEMTRTLIEECTGRVVSCWARFKFFGRVHYLPAITVIRPSIASLSATLRAIATDLPSQRYACFIRVYSVTDLLYQLCAATYLTQELVSF